LAGVNTAEVLHVVGALLVSIALAMVPSLAFGVVEGAPLPWLAAIAASSTVGAVLWFATPRRARLNVREGLVVVGVGWIAVVLAGSLPFLLTGVIGSPAAAFFESVSGFTTTGATVFGDVEALTRSILLWRSISHWVGGMGIIVLGVAILPLIGVGGAQLFRAEVPGIGSDRLQPRIAITARLLWGVYAILTATLTVLFVALGMSVFDAVNHAMSTLATGGFSTRTASLAAFGPAIQWITLLFMLVAGTNFTLHYRLFTGRWTAWVRDVEWRWYAGAGAVCCAAAYVALGATGAGWGTGALREASFNVVSVLTTTGFATADFALWPSVLQVLLVGLMFVGAMAGSTGGGFKTVRAVVVGKHAFAELRRVLHPQGVFVTRLGRTPVRGEVVLNVMAFLALYVATHAAGSLALAALGNDFVTATTAALAAMSSIGPGLGAVGPASHYGALGATAHVVLGVLMLLGRLEFYAILVLVLPETWRRAGGDQMLR
jgi:trk system potassium uptake protein TrkH